MRRCRIVLLCLLAACSLHAQDAARPYPDPGSLEVVTFIETWKDGKRSREVPVRIYLPVGSGDPCPVIIWSHGLGGNRDTYAYLSQFWASHGYVCVHTQHKGSDTETLREKGLRNIGQAANARNAADRPHDVSFVIDQLEEANKSHPKLKGRLRLDAIGIGGHSFGAGTTLVIGGQKLGPSFQAADPRVKALMPMSAPVPVPQLRGRAYADIKLPVMHMTGTKDDSPVRETKAAERRIPFDHIQGCPQWFINFQDGDHMIFSGRSARINAEQKKQDAVFMELIKQTSLSFWNATLKNDDSARDWLDHKMKDYLGRYAASVESKR